MEGKVFNDPVHGQIKIPALCIRIIDTPQFQRLRRIQQLGGVSYVYYGATHTRFEHSIGVCYLAGALLEHLRKEQKDLDIDEKDILCVQVAGLCHDLGHGPFSHVWEKNIIGKLGHNLKHEDLSVEMFKHLADKLKSEFKKHLKLSDDEEVEKELRFIRELIKGVKNKNGAWQMEGRTEHKAFLYDIISNKENGIDVDKWDYFARDCYYLGVKSSFDHLRLMNCARVLKVTDKHQVETCHISYRDKAASDVYGLFYTRNLLHQKAYQHKTVKAVECMLSDVILLVKELELTFQVQDDSTHPYSMKKTLQDVMKDGLTAYELLDDTVISRIKHMDPESYSKVEQMEQKTALIKAQRLIKKLEEREIYRCFPSTPIDAGKAKDLDTEKIAALKDEFLKNLGRFGLEKEEFDFDIVTYDYGRKDKNPVNKVYFYEKSNPDIPIRIHKDKVSMMLPETFSESRLLVLLKKPLNSKEEIDFKTQFEDFCERHFTSCSEEQAAIPAESAQESDAPVLYRR